MSKNRLLAPPEKAPRAYYPELDENGRINVKTIDGGLNTKTDPADLEDNELTAAANVFIRNNKITRRFGSISLTPTKPNSLPVRRMYTAKQFDGTVNQLRFTDTTIHRRGAVSWTEITDVLTPITAPANNIVSTDDRHFFSNNGANIIQEIDLAGNTYDALGNAPKYKYITSFFNRLVGAYLIDGGGNKPNQVGWCGSFDYDEWDPLVNLDAGTAPLEESQSDYADEITGIFGFANKMIILRQQSIWVAEKTPGANPFFFYTAIPGVGCTIPNSVQKVPNGIVFYDRRTNSVYNFDVERGLTIIGRKVEDSIYASIADPTTIFSSFDPIELEYKLNCPLQSSTIVQSWVYSFKSEAWWTDTYDSITCIDCVNFEEASVLIQDLPGNIEDLIGNIEDLGPNSVETPSLWFGTSTGDIEIQDDSVTTGYDTEIRSKTWTADDDLDLYFQRLIFTYQILASGSFTIQYSKDNQLTWTTHKTVTMAAGDIGKRMIIRNARSVKARQFNWRILSSTGSFDLIDFKATVSAGGYST